MLILNRGAEFNRIKEGNQALLLKAANQVQPTLECRYGTSISEIVRTGPDALLVSLKTAQGIQQVSASRVIARLGGTPPRGFLESCGIRLPHAGPAALPELSEQYETNVPGLYVIGSLAGFPLIKQAMNQGYDVVEFIHGKPTKPVEHALLGYQFSGLPFSAGLPGEPETDQTVALLMSRVPMFRQLNKLAFREVVIESQIYAAYSDKEFGDEARARVDALLTEASARADAAATATQRKKRPLPRFTLKVLSL